MAENEYEKSASWLVLICEGSGRVVLSSSAWPVMSENIERLLVELENASHTETGTCFSVSGSRFYLDKVCALRHAHNACARAWRE